MNRSGTAGAAQDVSPAADLCSARSVDVPSHAPEPEMVEELPPRPAFTTKAILTGIAGALAIAWVNNFNSNFLRAPDLIGNHLPVGPLALVMLIAGAWNPIVGRFVRRLVFDPRELTVALVIMCMCCWLPASGFYRYFHRMVALPVIQEAGKPAWQHERTLDRIPERLFPLLRNPERFALLSAIDEVAPADPVVRAVLERLDPVALQPGPLSIDAAERALSAIRTELAADAVSDPTLGPARSLVDGLAGVVPSASDHDRYATAFRAVREHYQERLPAARAAYERVYGGFVQGLPLGDRGVAFADLPWAAWGTAMAYWVPMVLLFMVCIVAMALVVHRQWSRHEQLSYPLAVVTTALVERAPGSLLPTITGNRLFWWGFLPVVAFHLLNYAAIWFPSKVPQMDLGWGFAGELRQWFPVMNNVGDVGVSSGRIYFLIVALAYFISSEIALSMGLSSILLVLLGVNVFTWSGASVDSEASRAGSYIAYAGLLLYTGRTYYCAVLRKALTIRRLESDDLEAVWAARIFLGAFACLVAVLAEPFGIDWFIALLFAATLMVLFLVLTRIVCESGTPFIQAGWYPGTFLASTLGFGALGSVPLVMVCYLTPILCQDPREALMPYVSNGLKLAEDTGVRSFPLAWIGCGAMALALVVCFIAWTKGIYSDGSFADGWAFSVPALHLDTATRGLTQLADTGQLAGADATHGLAKIGRISVAGNGQALGWMAFGGLAVAVCAIGRFSLSWWPLHPVVFLVWGTYPAICAWPSFLLGYAIKMLILRFGGGKIYNNGKPFFIGIILGEIVAIALVIALGYGHYLVMGMPAKYYSILPG